MTTLNDAAAPPQMKLLDGVRLATLIQTRSNGSPIGLPVWYDWTGKELKMFAAEDSHKVERARRAPTASVVVVNNVDEPSGWVAFDGDLVVRQGEGFGLASDLAARYLDLSDPVSAQMLDEWSQFPEAFCQLVMVPDRVRTGE